MAFDFDDFELAESALKYDNATEAELELSPTGSLDGDINLRVRGGLSGDELCCVSVNRNTSVRALKACVAHQAGVPASEQRLLAHGVQLCDHEVLGNILPVGQGADLEVGLLRASAARAKVLDDIRSGSVRLRDLDEEARSDAEIVIAALASDSHALQHATPAALQHRGLILQAVQLDGANLRYAAEELQTQTEVVMAAVRQSGTALALAPLELRSNRDVLIAAVEKDGLALQFASEELKGDFAVVLAAVLQNGGALIHASAEARRDRELLLTAVCNSAGVVLRYIDRDLRANAEIIRAAVELHGLALEYAVQELKQDRSIVFAAVQNNGLALAHAASKLQGDREVVIEAVRKQGLALQWASDKLRGEEEVILAAISQDIQAIRFAAPDAMLSPALMEVAGRVGVFKYSSLDMFLTVTPEVANRLHQKGEAFIFDARFLDSYTTSHVRGAYPLPLDQRLIGQAVLNVVSDHKECPIILYSDTGLAHGRDVYVARILRNDEKLHGSRPRPVLRLLGGLNVWKEKRLPVEGDKGVMVWSEREEMFAEREKQRKSFERSRAKK